MNAGVYEKHTGEQTNWQSPHSGVVQAGGMQGPVPNWVPHVFTHKAAPALRLDIISSCSGVMPPLSCCFTFLGDMGDSRPRGMWSSQRRKARGARVI